MATIDNSLEELLPKIGGFGLYQAYILTMICFTSGIMHPSIYMSFIFTTRQNKHRCKIHNCDTEYSKYSEKWVSFSIPNDRSGKPEKCLRYIYNGNGSCDEIHFDKENTERCKDGWVYEGDEWTIMHEFQMQCPENTKWFTLVGVINNLGQFFGLYLVGYFADRFGRRLIKVIIMVTSGVIGVMKVLYKKFWWYLMMEFLDAMVGASAYICGFVLVSEIMPLKWRALAGNILGAAFAIGATYLAFIAYIFRHWWWAKTKKLSLKKSNVYRRPPGFAPVLLISTVLGINLKTGFMYIVLVVHLPNFLVIFYLWLIPESIRWNLVNGRTEEAKKTLRKIAKVNKKTLSDEELAVLDVLPPPSMGMVTKSRLRSALKSKILMVRLILCALCWLSNNFVYYGLVYNSVEGLSDNIYLDFSLQALVEIPAYFFIEIVVRVFGRKKSLIGSYAVSCTACTIFIFVPKVQEAKRALWIISKFCASMSPGIIYIYTNELFPTYLRQSFMGTCSSFGKIGAMIAPVHRIFAQAWEHLPLILYSAATGTVMLIVLFFFPETKNRKLPDTVHEAENLRNAPEIKTDKNTIV